MQIVADLHLHSKYSRAVSKDMVVPQIARWAAIKGINLVATGDFTHPLWFRELKANLEEAGDGVYRLRTTDYGKDRQAVAGSRSTVSFLLSTEVSCIYSQGGRGRRIHILIFAPSLEVVQRINDALRARGVNLMSDGRPIMGLSAKNLTEVILGVDERCLLIAAHCWTPWFSLYGSMSGFDSLEECFGEYSKYIYAVETGLSSDPAMNWRIGELGNRSIVSFSDAHSPAKLGREATVFEMPEVSFENVRKAIISGGQKVGESVIGVSEYQQISKSDNADVLTNRDTDSLTPDPPSSPTPRILYTIEFYPEEGKYHYTGHRNCGVKHAPEDTKKLGTTCAVCGKRLTVGVMHRVEQLSNEAMKQLSHVDKLGVKWIDCVDKKRPGYAMLVPLLEILSEVFSSGVSSQKVQLEYERLTKNLGSEFEILLRTKPEAIESISGPKVREAIMKVRTGDIFIDPGYDGVFGTVKIWQDEEKAAEKIDKEQMGLF